MTNGFETPFFRDLMKLITPISVGMLIGLGALAIWFVVIPFLTGYYEYRTTDSCIYVEEYGSLCGDEMRNYIENTKWEIWN